MRKPMRLEEVYGRRADSFLEVGKKNLKQLKPISSYADEFYSIGGVKYALEELHDMVISLVKELDEAYDKLEALEADD